MKPLHTRLQEARKQFGIPWGVLERHYLLSWVLAGIAQVDGLREDARTKGRGGHPYSGAIAARSSNHSPDRF